MTENLSFYQTHSPMTDPGEFIYLYDDLPDDLGALFKVINGVLIHKYTADDEFQQSSEQRREKYLRTMRQRLSRIADLDPASLTIPREMQERQIAFCRDYAVFMTSILRHKGHPARLRVGFQEYFEFTPPFKGDHWVTEFWDSSANRWRLVDADVGGVDPMYLEEKTKVPMKRGIDLTDIRHNQDFYLAAKAWKLCRTGEADSKLFRVNKRWYGWPTLRGNLLHDFQALNNLEMGLFDYWDELHAKPESEMTSKDKAILDHVAEVCLNPDKNFDEMRDLFEEMPRTRVIRSRLHLIGVLGGGESQTASDLLESDMARLIEMTDSSEAVTHPIEADQHKGQPEYPTQGTEELENFDGITVLGARQNNLKNIDVRIPRQKLVVITGVSGSGKSSLAFDTIYAEGQRRYVESLSSFARQFMRQMEKPQVDKVIGLNPAVAIEQHTISPNSRSTVGSITEVIDYLRILFARAGRMHCPQCGRAVEVQSAYQIARRLSMLPTGTHFQVLAPLDRYGRYSPTEVLNQLHEDGFESARIDGEMLSLEKLGFSEKPSFSDGDHNIEALVAEWTTPPNSDASHLQEVIAIVERAFEVGKGVMIIALDEEELHLSSDRICPTCNLALPKLEPQLLNPNTIFGMCLECNGLGVNLQIDPDLIISKPHRSLMDDASAFYAIKNLRKSTSSYWINYIHGIADYFGANLEQPWNELPEDFRHTLIYGSEGKKIQFEFGAESETGSFQVSRNRELTGVVHEINRLYRQTKSENQRQYYRQFMREQPCPQCNGERLNKEARFVTLANRRFPEITDRSIGELLNWVSRLKTKLDTRQLEIGGELIAEIEERLHFICDVGLHYLTINRPGPTLSGGEAQRIRLASQIGSELMGVLYVLDEPSIGLHARDQVALLELLCHLRDSGNTVLVVEHDADTMLKADWLIDIGPGAGNAGGELVAAGTPKEVMANPASLTGSYLSGGCRVISGNGVEQRTPKGWIRLRGASLHNLKSVDVSFPLGTFTCITGVSGSGKSSLVTRTLSPALTQILQDGRDVPGQYAELDGAEQLRRVIHITQNPIGRNPRSNPGTYVGVLTQIRKVFAGTELALERNHPEGNFSFNTKGGRCEACEGYGANRVKMHFITDVWVRCIECEGKRFMPQILEIRYKDMNIADVLDMDVSEAFEFFDEHPKISRMLGTLMDVGLGYIKLGQSATTLSGGEAQRVKLAKELSKNTRGGTLYILDEPTTGLHFADIQKLLDILHRLVDSGNTVMVIEHNLDVVRTADWIIDLGPEGGEEGGYVIAEGTPEQVASVDVSYTGQFLKQAIEKDAKNGISNRDRDI
ncbi:MAG: excinuclease ABC subunit UvrA [Anaerolineales bacterium]|nr:excinuclease ABC subunit UvrA [Anaerolineales bacterium]